MVDKEHDEYMHDFEARQKEERERLERELEVVEKGKNLRPQENAEDARERIQKTEVGEDEKEDEDPDEPELTGEGEDTAV